MDIANKFWGSELQNPWTDW